MGNRGSKGKPFPVLKTTSLMFNCSFASAMGGVSYYSSTGTQVNPGSGKEVGLIGSPVTGKIVGVHFAYRYSGTYSTTAKLRLDIRVRRNNSIGMSRSEIYYDYLVNNNIHPTFKNGQFFPCNIPVQESDQILPKVTGIIGIAAGALTVGIVVFLEGI